MIDNNSLFTYILPNKEEIQLKIIGNTFKPTLSSTLLLEACINEIDISGSLLDMGCGAGFIGLSISKLFKEKIQVFASDISSAAIKSTRENSKNLAVNVHLKEGFLFEPWSNYSFDYIISSVSGISQEVATISPWYFDGIPCHSDIDGTFLTLKIIKNAHSYLKCNGKLLIPFISLSNMEKALKIANYFFPNYKKIISKSWFLPDSMLPFKSTLKKLKKMKIINFEEKFSTILCWTDIYVFYKDK